jgi:transcriptional regulator NrdR family protein
MTPATLDHIIELTDQLSALERQALIEHLQAAAQERPLTDDEWDTVFDSVVSDIRLDQDFSDHRHDWYNDDGK